MLVIFGGAWVTKLLYTYLTKVTHVTKIFIINFFLRKIFFLLRNKMKLNKKNKLNLSFFGNKLYTNRFILFLFLTIICKDFFNNGVRVLNFYMRDYFLLLYLYLYYYTFFF